MARAESDEINEALRRLKVLDKPNLSKKERKLLLLLFNNEVVSLVPGFWSRFD